MSSSHGAQLADTPGSYVQLSSGSHAFPTSWNISVTRLAIPWLKIFIDHDNRYTQFLCPDLADTDDISRYENTCPYEPTEARPHSTAWRGAWDAENKSWNLDSDLSGSALQRAGTRSRRRTRRIPFR
ncbi:hypothetical protein ABTX62_33780 [Streptomyces sp. NPDC096046]|uniref:poly(ethylene terephthalate) hydrolase family protein n=1 Tax=Streptomyces sp. NPDC096046 TaxID=3155542 RepID=UPI0033262158